MLRKTQSGYLLRESFAGFKRRKLTTGVTILIMGSALLVLAVLTLATLNLAHMLETARSSIDMRVFLNEGLENSQVAELQPRLMVIPGVQEVTYITAEAALADFRSNLEADAAILDLLETNPLPASFHLTFTAGARDLASVRSIRDEIGPWPEVSDIVFNQGWIDALEGWTFRFRMASLVVGLLVFLAAVFVISNTVKLTMATNNRLIQIQKLVGATNTFIRLPYLAEGIIQGLLAGLLAMGLLVSAGYLLGDRIGGLVFFTGPQVAGFVLFCVTLGLAGSWMAMRKYLTLESGI